MGLFKINFLLSGYKHVDVCFTRFYTESVCCGSKKKKKEEILACQSCLLETVASGFIWRFMRLGSVCSIKATLLDVNSAV